MSVRSSARSSMAIRWFHYWQDCAIARQHSPTGTAGGGMYWMRRGNAEQKGQQSMSLDSYVSLGRSGLRVSPLTLGTLTFGEDHGWGASVEESEAILAEYLERGGNFIDTANIYTNG